MLEQELELAQNLTAQLKGKIADVEGREASATAKEEENDRLNTSLKQSSDDLHERETAIANIESAQAVLHEARKERSGLDDQAKSLASREAEFAGKQSKHKELVQVLARDNQLIQDGNDLLKKREAELTEKEANYKDAVLEKLKTAV